MPRTSVGDISLYYELHGEGPALVLIGGLGADSRLMARTTERLAPRYRVLTFDNRGVGRSDQPDIPYSIAMMAQDAVGLMDVLGIERAHVLGLSMGGKIAMELAIAHPERVDRLVLVSTAAKGLGRLVISRPMRAARLLRRIGLIRRKYPQAPYAFERQRDASGGYDAVDRLDRIVAPTLILHSRNDRSVPLELAERTHRGIAGSRMQVFPGGHLFFVLGSSPGALRAVEEFLDS